MITAEKCFKMLNTRTGLTELLFLLIEPMWRSRGRSRRPRPCLRSLMSFTFIANRFYCFFPLSFTIKLSINIVPVAVVVVVSKALYKFDNQNLVECSTPDRVVRVRVLAWDIVLCSWARHFTLTVPLSTQVYKWLPPKCWG